MISLGALAFIAAVVWLVWEALTAPLECPICGKLLHSVGPCPACGFLCSNDDPPAVKKEP